MFDIKYPLLYAILGSIIIVLIIAIMAYSVRACCNSCRTDDAVTHFEIDDGESDLDISNDEYESW